MSNIIDLLNSDSSDSEPDELNNESDSISTTSTADLGDKSIGDQN